MLTTWLLGFVLGIFIGAFSLEAGVLAIVVALPAVIWALRTEAKAAAGGLLVGVGAGEVGLLGLAQAQCAAVNGLGTCSPLDLTPFIVVAAAFVALGGALTVLAARRSMNHG